MTEKPTQEELEKWFKEELKKSDILNEQIGHIGGGAYRLPGGAITGIGGWEMFNEMLLKETEQFSDKTNRLKYKQQQAELAEELRTIIKGDLSEECSLPFIGYEVMSDVFEKEGFNFGCEDEFSDSIRFIASKDGKEYRVYYSKENGTVSIALYEE